MGEQADEHTEASTLGGQTAKGRLATRTGKRVDKGGQWADMRTNRRRRVCWVDERLRAD